MADLDFIQRNRLRKEMKNRRRRLLAVSLPMLGLMALINAVLSGIGLIILVKLWRYGEKRMHGADGEDMVLGIPKAYSGSLVNLSNDYTIFNQVVVSHVESWREIDFIVVGPNGIFAIEVKHHRGEIRGSETDRAWRQKKRSHAGNFYEQDMRNPVSQIKSAVYLLKNYLTSHGVNNWIQGIVVFTNSECSLSPDNSTVPVLRLEQLAPYIRNFRPLWPLQRQGTVVRALKLLRAASSAISKNRLQPTYPQSIKYFMRDFVAPEARIQGIMNCDPKAARKNVPKAATPKPLVSREAVQPAPARSRPSARYRHFTVIQGEQRGGAWTKKVETTVFLKRVEIETTHEEHDNESF